MDANVLQQHKENIAPLSFGRSASKLGKALGESRSRSSLAAQRELLEAKLLSDELDDPLQEYVEYIDWIHNHYPQGANAESGLLSVLERCTSYFRDAAHYKNDARYLRVWLEYAAYSDTPRDVFVYLAKKRIGCELALYYEEFARFLEVRHAYKDAQDVYEVGLSRNARPLARLERSLAAFLSRKETATLARDSQAVPGSGIRQILGKRAADVETDPRQSLSMGGASASRKRVHVYGDQASVSIKDEVFRSDDNAVLTSLKAAKENEIAARPWNGEVLKQNLPTEQPAAKFAVYRDTPVPEPTAKATFEVVPENGQNYTMIRNPGKAPERLAVNLNLIYPSQGEEMCLTELLGLLSQRQESGRQERGGRADDSNHRDQKEVREIQRQRDAERQREKMEIQIQKEHREKRETEKKNHFSIRHTEKTKTGRETWPQAHSPENHTFTIPLRDESTQTAKSPTLTLYSRLTTNEVLDMFNDAAHNFQSDDESTRANEESTNYDGFVTETIYAEPEPVATPPTDHYDSGSSPFLDRP